MMPGISELQTYSISLKLSILWLFSYSTVNQARP